MPFSLFAILKHQPKTKQNIFNEKTSLILPYPSSEDSRKTQTLKLISAQSFLKRLTGLLIEKDASFPYALYLPHCRSVHSFGMRFNFAALFLDKKHCIQKVEILKPWRWAQGNRETDSIIEVSCNNANLNSLKSLVGSKIILTCACEHAP